VLVSRYEVSIMNPNREKRMAEDDEKHQRKEYLFFFYPVQLYEDNLDLL